jgi:hypothetical protein
VLDYGRPWPRKSLRQAWWLLLMAAVVLGVLGMAALLIL